jgi:hypothetical protein
MNRLFCLPFEISRSTSIKKSLIETHRLSLFSFLQLCINITIGSYFPRTFETSNFNFENNSTLQVRLYKSQINNYNVNQIFNYKSSVLHLRNYAIEFSSTFVLANYFQ